MDQKLISTHQIKYSFNQEKYFDFPDISCKPGESLLILGLSGCGKSTLLHLICGLIRPTSGTIFINNQDITKFTSSQMDRFRGEQIGVILQKSYFISSLNVLDNLLLFQSLNKKQQQRGHVFELLDTLGLKDKAKQMPNTLSQGEAQRLNFARALIHYPSLILADEPTSSLDDQNAETVISLLQKHSESLQAALIIVTHDKRLQEYFSNQIQLA